jgi:hypothetical protein
VRSRRRWSDLSGTARGLIVVGALIEGLLKIAALTDLKRRTADQIRGSKRGWAIAIIVVNSGGAVPLAYFVYGRRREPVAAPLPERDLKRSGTGCPLE